MRHTGQDLPDPDQKLEAGCPQAQKTSFAVCRSQVFLLLVDVVERAID